MVNKKRLTDLLQEETQKFTPAHDDSTIEVSAEKVVETENDESEEVDKTSAKKTPTNSTKSKTPTKADLELKIQELQENIEQYQIQETDLKQEISAIKTELSEQKTLAERLAKELYETKKTALQLAESNSKLIDEMKELKDQPAPQPEPKQETKKQPVKEGSKSLVYNPHKSYRPAPRVVMKENNNNDDFKDKTWLFD
jgi:chromosome segregation ATPase